MRWLGPLVGTAHLLFTAATRRLRPEHVLVDALIIGLPLTGRRGCAFARSAMPMYAAAALIDNQWLVLSRRGRIHTGDLERLDAKLFPAPGRRSWPAWWQKHTHPVLDFLAGGAYMTYLGEFFAVALVMFVANRRKFDSMSRAFLVANTIGVAGYLCCPAAPPWYVHAYGPGPADPLAPASPAGAARFDRMLGIRFFATFYSRNPNVFGAMPSMHVAYPVIVLWHVWSYGKAARIAAAAFGGLVCFAAVYLDHHWVVDVAAGLAVGAATCAALSAAEKRLHGRSVPVAALPAPPAAPALPAAAASA